MRSRTPGEQRNHGKLPNVGAQADRSLTNWTQRTNDLRQTCGKCGATRIDRQIGLEETPEQWVQKLVEVFREVRRVLRRDGTLWLEVGDSYASGMRAATRGYLPTTSQEQRAARSTAGPTECSSGDQPATSPKT